MIKNWGICETNSKYILDKISQGDSMCSIAKDLGCGVSSINCFLKKRGIKSKHKFCVNKDNMLINHKDEVIKLYNDGCSTHKIAKDLGYSTASVWHLLDDAGIQCRSINIYNVDETFFQKINTEEKSYVLGWWYSDGNVMPTGKIRISIAEYDKGILEKIAEIMKYDGPLFYKIKEGKRVPQWEFRLNRQVLAKQLISLGCFPNKSLKLKFPTKEQVPDELLKHFIRGYFDGDGSITLKKDKYPSICIAGSYDFIYGLKDKLPCEITNIYQRYKNRPTPQDSAQQLFIGKNQEIIKFLHWIYDGATIYLDRKYKKVQQVLNNKVPILS